MEILKKNFFSLKFVTGINSSSSSTSSNINPNPLPTTNNNHNSTTNRIRSSSTNSGGNNVKSVVSGSGGFGNNNNNNRAALISTTTKRFDQKMAHVIDVEVNFFFRILKKYFERILKMKEKIFLMKGIRPFTCKVSLKFLQKL